MSIATDVTGVDYAIADDAIVGPGGEVQVGNGASPEVFTSFAGVMSVKMGATKVGDIKITHLRSPNSHHEHRAGMLDTDQYVVTMTWLPDHPSQSYAGGGSGAFATGGLPAMAEARQNHNFRIKSATGKQITFRGYVAEFTPGDLTTDDKAVDATCAIQPIGASLTT